MAPKFLHKRARLKDKWVGLIFILPIFLLLSMSLVSAILETSKPIDVSKEKPLVLDGKEVAYNILWDKYKPLQIESWYGLPLISKTVAEAYISEHTSTCGTSCHSNIVINLKEDGVLIDDIRFYTIEGDKKTLQGIRSYQFYIKTDESEIEVEDYEWTCAPTGKINVNGTAEVKCENKLIGTHTETKPLWESYQLGQEVPAGTYEIKLEGQKKATRNVDWQIKTNGVWISDWATWGGNKILQLKVISDIPTNTWNTSCYNGTNWNTIHYQDGGISNVEVYEEAMNWNITGTGNCYQESANVSTACGGLDTGKYVEAGTWYPASPFINFIDGNWNTYGQGNAGTSGIAYINYTVPTGALTSSLWQIKAGSNPQIFANYTINSSCWYDINSQVTLNSPPQNYISPSNSVDFNCSATVTGGATLTNMSLWTNQSGTWERNQTNTTITGTTNISIFTNSYSNGQSVLWTCQACDSDSACGFASENRTVNVDTTLPSINIVHPATTEDIGYLNGNQNLSWIVTDTNFGSAWFNYNGTNISLNGATNSTTFQLDGSDRSLTFWANDTAGNVASLDRVWNYTLFRNTITYNPITTATSNETFTINLTYVTANWLGASAVLNYNGANYLSTKTATTNNLIFSNSIIVPNALTPTNYSFFWNVSLINATGTYYIITSSSLQLVNPLELINITSLACGAGFSSAFNFTSLIETNLTEINFTTVNYNLQYGSSGNSSALVSSGNLSNVLTFNICINSTSSYYVGYGEIQYKVDDYSARRFYIFQNTRVTNTTIANNLYSLGTASSTAFQITATDTTLSAYDGYYITLMRWYPNLNTYKIVDMGKTDALGQTVLNVKTNDVDYRLGLYSPDGTLVKLLEPIRMVCQTTPCVYSLIVDLTGVDLTTFLDIQSNLSYNPTTKVFTYIFNDPSQDTTLMNLTVWQDKADGNSVIICSTTSNSFTGILVCDVSAYTGQVRAEVWRSASIPVLIAQLLEDIRQTLINVANGKTIVLFIGLILTITMALMGVVSPPLVIILSIIALIPLIFLGLFSVALFVLIGAIGGIILHMLRRIS
jgi:hypothetical protein